MDIGFIITLLILSLLGFMKIPVERNGVAGEMRYYKEPSFYMFLGYGLFASMIISAGSFGQMYHYAAPIIVVILMVSFMTLAKKSSIVTPVKLEK